MTPSIEYGALSPMLIVFGVAIVGILVEAFAPRALRYPIQLVLALGGLVAAFVATVLLAQDDVEILAAEGSVAVDGPTLFLWGTILLLSFAGVLLMAERSVDPAGDAFAPQAAALPGSEGERQALAAGLRQSEVLPLAMFAVGGMLLFPASSDLLTMFVALEVLSLPLYVLCALARRRRLLSQEAGLKYFMLGAFSSAFFLFGAALLYGYAGTVSLSGIADAVGSVAGQDALLLVRVPP